MQLAFVSHGFCSTHSFTSDENSKQYNEKCQPLLTNLFNEILNTLHFRFYGVGYMVKDHSNNDRRNSLPLLHELYSPISSKGSIVCSIPQTEEYMRRVLLPPAHHWLEREIGSKGQPWRIEPKTHRTKSGCSTTELYLAPCMFKQYWFKKQYKLKRCIQTYLMLCDICHTYIQSTVHIHWCISIYVLLLL